VNDASSADSSNPLVRTIDFVFDPDVDTADNLAAEISEEFALSPTDTEICAAALREWLAKDMPGGRVGRLGGADWVGLLGLCLGRLVHHLGCCCRCWSDPHLGSYNVEI